MTRPRIDRGHIRRIKYAAVSVTCRPLPEGSEWRGKRVNERAAAEKKFAGRLTESKQTIIDKLSAQADPPWREDLTTRNPKEP